MNIDQDWIWAKSGMTAYEGQSAEQYKNAVAGILGRYLQPGPRAQIFNPHPSLDFRLHKIVIYPIREVGMRVR